MSARISRRKALGLLAGAGVAVGAGAILTRDDGGGEPAGPPSTTAAPRPTPQDVALIGERYLAQFPQEASVEALSAAVDPPPGAPNAFAVLRGRIHQELAAGEVVVVDGWVLARTEARLCALVALGG